jgi:hypothetical protein
MLTDFSDLAGVTDDLTTVVCEGIQHLKDFVYLVRVRQYHVGHCGYTSSILSCSFDSCLDSNEKSVVDVVDFSAIWFVDKILFCEIICIET